ncbi:MAG: nuclear transport factor 2 family protein [Pyrinomonadaceae bacterium]|nr:nuclear transport factor 2 family protein [Pyrinomonadaceae bacterium]
MKRVFAVLSTLLALTFTGVSQENKQSPALSSLVAAERAFARTSVEKGIRDSFLEFFADDGINFQPHPTKTREAYLSRPAPAARPPLTLNWEPVWADVSAAGDLGYTTGPYTLTDNSHEHRPTRHGYYFSIWKRQPDGNWKVALDLGTQNPAPQSPQPSFYAPAAVRLKKSDAKISQDEVRAALVDLERKFQREARAHGFLKAFPVYLTSESRLHRQQMLPLIGKDAIIAYLSQRPLSLVWETIRADIAESGDLGYAYGIYELRDNPESVKAIEKGYYVRVWKRRANGKWTVALDVTSPLPPEQK